jgi:hypothetical protein
LQICLHIFEVILKKYLVNLLWAKINYKRLEMRGGT